jgi:hypothetical protein
VSGSGPSYALAESLADRGDGGRLGRSHTQLGTALLSRSVLQITNNEVRLILWSLACQCGFLATIRNNSHRLATSCLARVTIHRRNGGPDLRGPFGTGEIRAALLGVESGPDFHISPDLSKLTFGHGFATLRPQSGEMALTQLRSQPSKIRQRLFTCGRNPPPFVDRGSRGE